MPREHATSAGKRTRRCTLADGLSQYVRPQNQTSPPGSRLRSNGLLIYLMVMPDHASVRKGDAGSPSLLKRLHSGLSPQA